MNVTTRPNVIVLMGDEHTFAHTGCYGSDIVKTPTIDAIAERGAIFDAAYCASPICAPCRASMMTSRYVHELETWDNASPFRSDWPTFAHDFTAAGYRTALCGKMHFVGPDQHHGFTERWFPDIYPAGFDWTHHNRGEVAVHTWGQQVGMVEEAGPGTTDDMDYDEMVRARAVTGLRHALQPGQPPLMAIVSFTSPHAPFKAPQEYYDLYADVEIPLPDLPEGYQEHEHEITQRVRAMGRFHEELPPETIRASIIAQMARTTLLDDHLAKLMRVIEESGQADNTYILYCSDHGDMMGEHNLWFKNCPYEWSARVPFVIAGPGIAPGQRIRETVDLHDLNPTLCGLAGIDKLDYPRVGRDLSPLLHGKRDQETGRALFEMYADGTVQGYRTIVKSRWKLTTCDGADPELFDLETDPGEWTNRAADPECARIRDELLTELMASWGRPAELDEKRWQSEERRMAINAAYEKAGIPAPTWQRDWRHLLEPR